MAIRTNFSDLPFDETLPYHVHVYPVDYRYDPTMRCGPTYTGGHFDPTNRLGAARGRYSEYCSPSNITACEYGDLSGRYGRLTNGTTDYEDSDLNLNGIDGILYRSVVIHMANGARYVCATIEPTTSLDSTITARAAFYGNLISGNVYFFQQDASSESTKIFVDLSPVNTDRNTLANLDWVIKDSAPGVRSRLGSCSLVGERYNPRGRDVANCDRTDTSRCPEYALTEKHGYLSLTGESNKFFFTEVSGITLSGPNSIIGRSLVIELGSRIVGCAAIEQVRAVRVRAQVTSGFEFSATQYFPFSATRVSSTGDLGSFSRLELQQNGYISGVCDNSTSRYDPFVQTVGGRGVRTPDASPLGDLMEQIPSGSESMMSSIPLSGPFSAADRTIRYTAGGSSGCTSLAYDLRDRTDNAFVIRANATFRNQGSSCKVYFSQLVSGVSYLPSFGDRASNPNFQSGDVIITDRCSNATEREYRFVMSSDGCTTDFYNPYEIMRQAANRTLYDRDCDRGDQRRCTVGNNLRQVTSNIMRSYVNTNLELTGAYGVASGGIYVQLNGMDCAALEVSGVTSAVYSVDSCEQFNNRLGNAIEDCVGVGSNTFLPIECSDNNNNVVGPVTVDVGMVFAPGTDTAQAQECILASINSGNKLGAFFPIFLMFAIFLLMIA